MIKRAATDTKPEKTGRATRIVQFAEAGYNVISSDWIYILIAKKNKHESLLPIKDPRCAMTIIPYTDENIEKETSDIVFTNEYLATEDWKLGMYLDINETIEEDIKIIPDIDSIKLIDTLVEEEIKPSNVICI